VFEQVEVTPVDMSVTDPVQLVAPVERNPLKVMYPDDPPLDGVAVNDTAPGADAGCVTFEINAPTLGDPLGSGEYEVTSGSVVVRTANA